MAAQATAAMRYESTTAGPALSCAATPTETNIPAPTMPPTPRAVSAPGPSTRCDACSTEDAASIGTRLSSARPQKLANAGSVSAASTTTTGIVGGVVLRPILVSLGFACGAHLGDLRTQVVLPWVHLNGRAGAIVPSEDAPPNHYEEKDACRNSGRQRPRGHFGLQTCGSHFAPSKLSW